MYNPAMTNRKRSVRAWIVGTLITVPVLYVLSFGPACWWLSCPAQGNYAQTIGALQAPRAYFLVGSLLDPADHTSQRYRLIAWYGTLLTNHAAVYIPAQLSDSGDITIHGPILRPWNGYVPDELK